MHWLIITIQNVTEDQVINTVALLFLSLRRVNIWPKYRLWRKFSYMKLNLQNKGQQKNVRKGSS